MDKHLIIDGEPIEIPIDAPTELTPEQKAAADAAAAAGNGNKTPEQIAAEKAAAEKAAAEKAAADAAANKPATVNIQVGDEVKEYTLDENGNAVLDGVIAFTKEELIAAGFENNPNNDDDSDEDVNIHETISSISGIQLFDEAGKPLVFKEGVEGLAEREVAVKNLYYNEGRRIALKEIFEKNPDLQDMYSYKMKHGSLDNYVRQTNFSELQITDSTDAEELKSYIREYQMSLGNDSTTVEKLIRLSENDETLRADAITALDKLKANQKAKAEEIENSNRLAAAKEQEAIQNYYGVVVDEHGKVVDLNKENSLYDTIVKKGRVGDLLIPKEGLSFTKDGKKQQLSRLDVFAYFYNPVDDKGTSQADIDERKRLSDTNNFIVQGIKNLVGNDVSSLKKALEASIRINNSQKILKISTKQTGSGSDKPKNIEDQIRKGTATIVMS